MTHDEQLVEQIVRHVMQRVRTGSAAAERPHAAPVVAQTEPAPSSFFDDAVVTQETLERRLNGAVEIRISPSSIVTPAAHDFLKSRNVAWTRSQRPELKSEAAAAWNIACLQTSDAIDGVVAELEAGNLVRTRERMECDLDAVAWALNVLTGDTAGAVVLTDEPELIACRVNRQPNVRGAAICSRSDLKRINRRLRPNLVCIDARPHSFFELRNLLRAVVSGPLTVPEDWKEPALGR